MQLFGLRKTPDLSLASPQGSPLVATSSGPATGGCSNNRPFARPSFYGLLRWMGYGEQESADESFAVTAVQSDRA
jgi:hypothetical protein